MAEKIILFYLFGVGNACIVLFIHENIWIETKLSGLPRVQAEIYELSDLPRVQAEIYEFEDNSKMASKMAS